MGVSKGIPTGISKAEYQGEQCQQGPSKIHFFTDGVTEGEYQKILNEKI